MYRILYNPLSKSGKNQNVIKKVKKILSDMNESFDLIDIIQIKDMRHYLDTVPLADKILIVGGDGTVHYLLNYLYGKEILHKIYFYGAGTGNDFARNAACTNGFIYLNDYLNNLPVAYFLGIERRFINGCGIGMDAYVCDFVNNGNGKSHLAYKINTLKGFFKYDTVDLDIEIDGVVESHKNVWCVSLMNGKYQGGGMMFAPDAVINDGFLDLCLIKEYSRFNVLRLFPKIYKGKHAKHIIIKKCQNVKITSKKGLYIQLDGEVISDVKELVVNSK